MGTNLIRAMLLVSASAVVAAAITPTAVYAQETSYQIDIPAQSMGDALRALGKATKQNIVFSGSSVRGKRSAAVRGRMTTGEALARILSGSGLVSSPGAGGFMVQAGNASGAASGGAAQGQATLVGAVRDHRTGAALKGARVEIVETGTSTSTGDLGDFRFTRLPTGEVTLRVSYLGFPEQTETVAVVGGLSNRAEVYLGSGVTTEIVVIGQVSARAQALNQERSAENSTTVISGDLLGNFNGTTIADSLRRAPGVSFQQNVNTGDGTNIIVRGLTPDYNQVSLNGVPLPAGVGGSGAAIGRSPDLSNMLSDSVSEIKISKTLLANQDSAGTGGLVEIETKSPLDRPKRYFNFSADGTKRGKGFGEEYLVSGTASLRFGAENNFGVSASVQYRDQKASSFNYSAQGVFGAYLPLLPNGQPAAPETLDPRTAFPFYDGAEFLTNLVSVGSNETRSRSRTISLSSEWQVSDATNLRLDYVQANQRNDSLSSSYTLGDTFGLYAPSAVPGLGGETRYVYTNFDPTLFPTNRVEYQPGQTTKSEVVSFRGTTSTGPLTLGYNLGYTRGSSFAPFSGSFSIGNYVPVDATYFPADAIDPVTGTMVTLFGPRSGHGIPVPRLTPVGFDALRTGLAFLNGYYSSIDNAGRSQNWRGDFSGKYEFGSGLLKYIEAGAEYRRSTFRTIPAGSLSYEPVRDAEGYPVPLGDVGLVFDNLPFSTQSGDTLYRFPTEASIRQFIGRIDDYAAEGLLIRSIYPVEPILTLQPTREDSLIGYAQGRVDIGKLEIIGGVRIDRTRVSASSLNGTLIYDELGQADTDFFNATRTIVTAKDSLTSILPRILVNYRPVENVVIRAGYYSTVARPPIGSLNARRNITFDARRSYGPTFSQPGLTIDQGNPGLKPARTHNFDISGEWYDGRVGVIKLSLFYKRIDNLLETNALRGVNDLGDYDLPDHPAFNNLPADTFVTLTRPGNSPDPATAWGVEVAVERQLSFLPGILSGLGIYANYSYSDSKKTEHFNVFAPVFDAGGTVVDFTPTSYDRKLPFSGSPKHSGTLGLTYTKDGFDGSLYYTAQAGGFAAPLNYGIDLYNEGVSSLDLRATYRFELGGSDVRIAFEARNLLDGKGDPNTEAAFRGGGSLPKYYTSGNYLGGRKFSLGASVTF
jgi:TonB-dependent receptor